MTKQVTLTCEKCGSRKTIDFPSAPGRYKTVCQNPQCNEAIIFTVTDQPAKPVIPKRIEQCGQCGAKVGLPDNYRSPQYKCPKCGSINQVRSLPIASAQQAPAATPAFTPAFTPAPIEKRQEAPSLASARKAMTPSEAARAAGLIPSTPAPNSPFGQGSPLGSAPTDEEENTNIDRDLFNRAPSAPSAPSTPPTPPAIPRGGIQLNIHKKAFSKDELMDLRKKGLYHGEIPGEPSGAVPPPMPGAPQSPFGQGTPIASKPLQRPQEVMSACVLRRVSPGMPEHTWQLHEGINIIGRRDPMQPCDVEIEGDSSVSRRSVQIEMIPQGNGFIYRMRVLKSLNPVLHNRRELQAGRDVYLAYNDTIQLGDTMLSFMPRR